MGSIGSFGAFTQARLGIYAAQHGLTVTGNNISNINTTGYTRQVLDQVSLRTGGSDRYQSKYGVRVGNGALCTGVSQIRDPYLDIRYRTSNTDVHYNDTMLDGLNNIASILDEVADGDNKNGLLHAELSEFATALRDLSANAGQEDFDVIARTKAENICTLFQNYAGRLEKLKESTEQDLRQQVNDVNTILEKIRDLNAAIRKSDIHGNNALEMRDERNRQIDELSKYLKIDVTYSMEDVGAGQQVEKLTIKLGDANPDLEDVENTDRSYLVDGIYCAQLTTPKDNPNYDENATTGIGQYRYLDENGNGTNDPVDAFQEFDDGYNILISKMKDVKGREWSEVDVKKIEITEDDYNANERYDPSSSNYDKPKVEDDGKGTKTSATYVKALNPVTKAYTYYKVLTTTQYAHEVELDDNDLHGSVQAVRELLTEEGEFASPNDISQIDENAAIKRGIPYYQKCLDLLAQKFAEEFNKLNEQYAVDENGNYIDAHGGNIEQTITDKISSEYSYEELQDYQLEDKDENGNPITVSYAEALKKHGLKVGLFSNSGDSDDMTGITAANISISKSWHSGEVHILTKTADHMVGMVEGTVTPPDPDVEQSTQNDNVNHMITLIDKDLVYNPQELNYYAGAAANDKPNSSHLFEGSFQEMMNKMSVVLGDDQSTTNIQLNTTYLATVELDTGRDSVAGVDLNDEAMNMMQYQKAYSAACRLMTALDEVLDKLVNGTAV